MGIDRFREHFADHQAQYALIGGVACDLIFAEAGLEFRVTKDFDVLVPDVHVDVSDGSVPVPDSHKQILDRRLEAYQANPHAGRPWNEVREELLSKHRC